MLTPPPGGLPPTINGVVALGSYLPDIQAGAWVTIFGWDVANVADPGVNGLATEIANGVMPTTLIAASAAVTFSCPAYQITSPYY